MKSVLKSFTVVTITICITTLQFSMAMAQNYESPMETRVKRSQAMPKRSSTLLATPSMYLAPQSGSTFEFGYLYQNISLKEKTNGVKINQIGHQGGAAAAVALNPNIFAGVKVTYRSAESVSEFQGEEFKSKLMGESEPVLFAGGRLNLGPVSALMQFDYKMGIGDAESKETVSGEKEMNGKSGESSISPKISIFTNQKNSLILGGQLGYTVRQEGTRIHTDEKARVMERTTVTGGNETNFIVFLETPQLGHSFGTAVVFSKHEDKKLERLNQISTSDGDENIVMMAYGNIRASSLLSFQPVLAYHHYLNDRTGNLELSEQSTFIGMLNARLTF